MPYLGFDFLLEGTYALQLLNGLAATLGLALVSLVLSAIFGLVFAYLRLINNPLIQAITILIRDGVRIIPLLVWLFLGYFGLPLITPTTLSSEAVSIGIFTLWGTIEIGELVYSTIVALPNHHSLSAKALGLSPRQTFLYILAPLCAVKVSPGVVNLATRMIKSTSLLAIIGVTDVVRVGRQIIELRSHTVDNTAFSVYAFLFLLYFLMCYPLGKIAEGLEKKSALFESQ